jgi:hypothetical protein
MSREKDHRTPLPQLVVTAGGYRAFDPEMVKGRKDLQESVARNELRFADNSGPAGSIVLTLTALGGGGLSLLLGASMLSFVIWFLVGAAAGLVAGGVLTEVLWTDREKEYREDHRGAPPWVDIDGEDPRAAVCSLAESIAATRAWQDGILDEQRHLATIVWSAVSKDPADATDEDAADIEVVTENLRELLRVSRDLDHRREYGTPAVDERISAREPTARARALSSEAVENGRAVRDLL